MRCHWEHDPEIGRWFYPGCMGGAVYGPRHCTCGPKPRRRDLEQRVAILETELKKLKPAIAVIAKADD